MQTIQKVQGIIQFSSPPDDDLLSAIQSFLIDKQAQNLSPQTLRFYRAKLKVFAEFCFSQAITRITQMTPPDIRQFMFHLQDQGHNPGGCHAFFRTLRTFLNWYDFEWEPPGWRNPIKKIKPPRLDLTPLDPLSIDIARAMLSVCKKHTYYGDRDTAIILLLMDTGLRAGELLALDIPDLDLLSGSILIRKTKSRRFRTVYFGRKARKALRALLRYLPGHGPLFCTTTGARLDYSGLRQLIRRRAVKAGVPVPQIHAFRRFFALQSLRNGMNIYALQAIMGHSDLQVLRRYIKQTDSDLRQAHALCGPVDLL